MKIVIDIDEDVYNRCKEYRLQCGEAEVLESAVARGTPLPKGHGRLIDADSMKTMKNIQSANFNAVELIRLWIDKQDTIIKADTESEE